MNVIVVDTSSWVSYLGGAPNADLDLALKEGRVFVPPVVVAELLSARLKPSERQGLVSLLKELPLCESSFEHWARVGELRSHMASKGLTVSTPDAHVVQCSLDIEGYLLTDDHIFKMVAKICPLKLL